MNECDCGKASYYIVVIVAVVGILAVSMIQKEERAMCVTKIKKNEERLRFFMGAQ